MTPLDISGSPGADRGKRRILVVDDNEEVAEALTTLLADSGHQAVVAKDGATALARARELLPDTMVCDLDLPDMTGYALARAVRAEAELSRVQLIALSGYTRPQDREEAKAAGFDLHLGKPVDPDLLERVIAETPRAYL
jgi:CheY-like chemotaxis protein